ncbi:MAG: hypothetical protein ACD_5C00032G0005 [uncultured bacterium]|nr:MAG: hypothetical protein ACD_5C00032G0005 [uncultured bacterium]
MKKIFLLSALMFSLPFFASAQDYDFYVDMKNNDTEEGTQEKPFRTIQQAIEKANLQRPGARKIFINDGEYAGEISLGDSISLFGQSKEKTIIKAPDLSTLSLTGNNKLQDLTISGGLAAITINGTASIENCIIQDAKKKGIDLPEGSSLVKISNSQIINNGGKGLYVQKGRSVILNNNTVANNKGEGFDIRQNIFGSIFENDINSNAESGIEILSSASDVLIKNNKITKNLANGIANQSYPDMPDLGKIKIQENKITENGKYGVYCGAPSGGVKTKTFFSESILVEKNYNENNTGKPVSGACHFERQTTEFINNIYSNIGERLALQYAEQDSFYALETEIDRKIVSAQKISSEISKTSIFRKIFLGIERDKIQKLNDYNQEIFQLIDKLSSLSNKTEISTIKESSLALIDSARKEISAFDAIIKKSNRTNKIFFLPQIVTSLFH